MMNVFNDTSTMLQSIKIFIGAILSDINKMKISLF